MSRRSGGCGLISTEDVQQAVAEPVGVAGAGEAVAVAVEPVEGWKFAKVPRIEECDGGVVAGGEQDVGGRSGGEGGGEGPDQFGLGWATLRQCCQTLRQAAEVDAAGQQAAPLGG